MSRTLFQRSPAGFARAESGAAAVEFAMFALVLAPLILNLGDLGYYAYTRMEVENAAQAGAQAAWANCPPPSSPTAAASSTNCPQLSNAVTSAVQSTGLGSNVTWSNSSTVWSGGAPNGVATYCPVSTTNQLVQQNSTCSATNSTGAAPGTYVMIQTSYTFTPLFKGATIASLFPSTITATTYQRLY
jgi:Flp pilus assembly protein TadG